MRFLHLRRANRKHSPSAPGDWKTARLEGYMARPMPEPSDASAEHVVFLLDVDNTLIDNDRLKDDLARRLRGLLGEARSTRFWVAYEEVRAQTGTVDYPLTFERFRSFVPDGEQKAALLTLIMEYPFASCLYPQSLATLAHLRSLGQAVIVSDGDTTYQPRKIAQSGLAHAVDWQVVVYMHKEEHLDEILARWPAAYYVMVDDKPRLLSAVKRLLPQRVVTVQVMQGHYAGAAERFSPPPDVTLMGIGDLQRLSIADLKLHLAASQP